MQDHSSVNQAHVIFSWLDIGKLKFKSAKDAVFILTFSRTTFRIEKKETG